MFWPTSLLYAAYLLIVWGTESRRAARRPTRREGLGRLPTAFCFAALGAFIQLVEYDGTARWFYAALALATALAHTREELDRAAVADRHERYLAALDRVTLVVVLGITAVCWRFIDGASFIVNIILPFTTKNLRPLCAVFYGALTVSSLLPAIYWACRGTPTEGISRAAPSES